METSKLITLFSLISLSLCASFSDKDSSLKASSHSHSHKHKQCFCYLHKQTGIPIAQILSSGSEKLERLAVYLYKDPKTDEIIIFLPNEEKQIMIPDLTFDEGDHLNVSSFETLPSLFKQFPSLISKRKSDELPDISQILKPDNLNKKLNNRPINTEAKHNEVIKQEKVKPLDYDTNVNNDHQTTIETATDTSNLLHLIPVNINTSNGVIQTVQPNIPSINTVTENQKIDKGLSNELVNHTDDNEKKDETETKPSDYVGPSTVKNDIIIPINNVAPNTNNIAEVEAEKPIFYEEITPASEIYTIRPNVHEIVNEPNVNVMETNSPIHIYSQTQPQTEKQWYYNKEWLTLPNLEVPNSSEEHNDENPFIPNNIIKSERTLQIPLHVNEDVMPEKQEWTSHPVKYINKEITPEDHASPQDISIISMHPDTLIQKYQGINGKDLHDTFDNWFDNQMKRVHFTNSRASNLLDIYTFKHLIEKTLREKGLYITHEGLIIDSEGNVLQTSNLGLRPILIGNSLEYKNLLQGKFNTFKLPTHLPYLEAVLITSINPPKILGIIPLGKTYLPKNYQKSLSLYIDDDGSPKNICGGGCNDQHKIVTPSVTTKHTEGYFTFPGYKIHQPKMSSTQYSHRIFPFDQINTLIDKVYNTPITEDKILNLPHQYVVDTPPITPSRPVVQVPVPVAKVSPGFRIIGGNAATSSGTPLSNKGRSGYESSETSMDSADSELD